MSVYRRQSFHCCLCSLINSWPVCFSSSEIASSNPSLSRENRQLLTSPLPVTSEYFVAIYHSIPFIEFVSLSSYGSNQLIVFHRSRTFQLLLFVSHAASPGIDTFGWTIGPMPFLEELTLIPPRELTLVSLLFPNVPTAFCSSWVLRTSFSPMFNLVQFSIQFIAQNIPAHSYDT